MGRHVLGPLLMDAMIVLIGQAGLVLQVNGIAGPLGTIDADVVFAVAIPIAGDGPVLLIA
jgi:hypothetical protein